MAFLQAVDAIIPQAYPDRTSTICNKHMLMRQITDSVWSIDINHLDGDIHLSTVDISSVETVLTSSIFDCFGT